MQTKTDFDILLIHGSETDTRSIKQVAGTRSER